jgi:3-phosphoshikimate 1-carboxyvinyltransferase
MNHGATPRLTARPGRPLGGEIEAPGDKSISHRALILGGLARGETTISGLLEGEDVLRTAAATRNLGADVERQLTEAGPVWTVRGGDWRNPERPLYFGNSGTGCRLMLGAVAGRQVAARFDGDDSLRRRPMARVAAPLARMGAKIDLANGRLPLALAPAPLAGVAHELEVASAQVKSAILLAGLGATGVTTVVEPEPSRDHTERMLSAFGCEVEATPRGSGRAIRLAGGQPLTGAAIDVPGDPSSAAFLIAAALIVPGSDILVRNVLVNPLRTGFFDAVREMGADIAFESARALGGEPVADIRARYSKLRGVAVPAARAPSMIDEYPILSVVAAFATGETEMRGLAELRVKESDRLAAIEAGLKANGVKTASGPDWLKVTGVGAVEGGGEVETRDDHRIAMSFLVLGLGARRGAMIDDGSMIATSFPGFVGVMRRLGGAID